MTTVEAKKYYDIYYVVISGGEKDWMDIVDSLDDIDSNGLVLIVQSTISTDPDIDLVNTLQTIVMGNKI